MDGMQEKGTVNFGILFIKCSTADYAHTGGQAADITDVQIEEKRGRVAAGGILQV